MSRRIAEVALAYMRTHGHKVLTWGDGALTNIAGEAGIDAQHPLDRMQKVADALARAPNHFEVRYIHGCDSRGRNRRTRSFWPVNPDPDPPA